jgi:N-acetylglucosaminyldiphosphoundecaprenol N-acetyl-beta-D-mannosaminyltransferase
MGYVPIRIMNDACLSSVKILGVRVNRCTMRDLNDRIMRAIRTGEKIVIPYHNLHSVYLYHRDQRMRALYRASTCIQVDGMLLVMLARLQGKALSARHRVTYVDWIPSLMKLAAQYRWRVQYVGSKPDVAERGAERLRQRYDDLQIATTHGYFDTDPEGPENREVLDRIAAVRPDLLIVGMGMPRQEHWVLDNLDEIRANAILLAGAAIDYFAGEVATPPRWLGPLGLEWLYRLAYEPRRLFWRYLVEPWLLLWLFASGQAVDEDEDAE